MAKGKVLARKRKPSPRRTPWNKGTQVGQKLPLRPGQIRSIRSRLKSAQKMRDLALFHLAIDSGLNACDTIGLRVRDIARGHRILTRATVTPRGSQSPIQFEITEQTREAVAKWMNQAKLKPKDFLFPSRLRESPHLSLRQYARIVDGWVQEIGLDPAAYGTQTLRRTKASLIYRRTKNLFAVQLLLGHTKLESTVRYLGTEIDDA